MEYVDGLDLARIVKAKGPMPVSLACAFVHQAALGLQHAHRAGLVHRDIKPGNLMLTREEDRAIIKVLDFGLAKAAGSKRRSIPAQKSRAGASPRARPDRPGQMMGTPNSSLRNRSSIRERPISGQTSTAWAARCISS